MTSWTSPCGRMTLRLGRWQDVLGDVTECAAVIADIPYSDRTINGYRTTTGSNPGKKSPKYGIQYKPLDPEDVAQFWTWGQATASHWCVVFCDHVQWYMMEDLAPSSTYTFAPIPCVRSGAPPRFMGDGPTSATDWLMVSRPRGSQFREHPRSRPGFYVTTAPHHDTRQRGIVVGAKELGLMRRIVKDYSEPNDLICDPFCGSATTLLAAAMEGRRAIGAEMDPATYALAVKRLSKGYTERLFTEGITGKQEKLL